MTTSIHIQAESRKAYSQLIGISEMKIQTLYHLIKKGEEVRYRGITNTIDQ